MRVMRMLVLFDLPTGNKSERKSYAEFRKFLLKDGYHMDQFSVYSRVVLTRESVDSHMRRLKANLPLAGAVTVITLTEKQYEDRAVLIDTRAASNGGCDLGAQLTLAF